MIDYTALKAELTAALAGLGYNVYPELPTAGAETPCAVLAWPDAVEFHASLGQSRVELVIMIGESTGDMGAAQRAIDFVLSWPGLAQPLEAHRPPAPPVGGYRSLQVHSAGNVRTVQNGPGTALVADLNLEIFT